MDSCELGRVPFPTLMSYIFKRLIFPLVVIAAILATPQSRASLILTDINLQSFLVYYRLSIDFDFRYVRVTRTEYNAEGDPITVFDHYEFDADASAANTPYLNAAMAFFFAYLADDAGIEASQDFSQIAGSGYDKYLFFIQQSEAYYNQSILAGSGNTAPSTVTLAESTGGLQPAADAFLNTLFGYLNGGRRFYFNSYLGEALNWNISTLLGLYDEPTEVYYIDQDLSGNISAGFDRVLQGTGGQFLNLITGNDSTVNFGVTTYWIDLDTIGTSYYNFGVLQYGVYVNNPSYGASLLNEAISNIYAGYAYNYAFYVAIASNYYSGAPYNFQYGLPNYQFYGNNALYYYALSYYYGYMAEYGVPPDTTASFQYIAGNPDTPTTEDSADPSRATAR